MANSAYELAMLLRRHCGGFDAIIPRRAKSAATLLSLGADSIYMNDHAELGPLDFQVFDRDREELLSGLDEVQSLEWKTPSIARRSTPRPRGRNC